MEFMSSQIATPIAPIGNIAVSPTGKVVVLGDGPSIAVLDPDTQRWSGPLELTTRSLDIRNVAFASPNHLFISGYLPPEPGVVIPIESLDYESAPAPDRFLAAAVSTPDHRAMLAGGVSAWNPATGDQVPSSSVSSYSATDRTWNAHPPLPGFRVHGSGALTSSGHVVLWGGRVTGVGDGLSIDLYDTAADHWCRTRPPWDPATPDPERWERLRAHVKRLGGRVDAAAPSVATFTRGVPLGGGCIGLFLSATQGNISVNLQELAVLDPATCTWSEPIALPVRVAAAASVPDGRLVVRGYRGASEELWTWSPGGWAPVAPPPSAGRLMAGLEGGRLVVSVDDDRALALIAL
jgi:hypothetical protein